MALRPSAFPFLNARQEEPIAVRPAGFEPATCGLATSHGFHHTSVHDRIVAHRTEVGPSLHRLRCGAYGLYGSQGPHFPCTTGFLGIAHPAVPRRMPSPKQTTSAFPRDRARGSPIQRRSSSAFKSPRRRSHMRPGSDARSEVRCSIQLSYGRGGYKRSKAKPPI